MRIIERDMWAELLTEEKPTGPVAVSLRYDASDPLAVSLVFTSLLDPDDLSQVTWVFARDLLSEGIHLATGVGDVRVSPSSWQTTDVELLPPTGSCRVQFYTDELQEFVRQTVELSPPGSERCGESLERMLRELLRSV
jgi:hypothetical protein